MSTAPLSDLPRFTFLDPASKRKPGQTLKKVRARTALVTIAVDPLQRIFVLDAWADKSTTQTVMERVFTINERYHPRRFGVEANGLQELFGDALFLEAKRRGISIPFTPVYQPTNVDKHWRIRSLLQPVIGRGQLFMLDNQHELHVELTAFPLGQTVDLVDALASAIALAPQRQASLVRNDERDQLAAYLRKSGAPPNYIEKRMSDFDRAQGRPAQRAVP